MIVGLADGSTCLVLLDGSTCLVLRVSGLRWHGVEKFELHWCLESGL
jgi:hypothetical protein